MSAHTHNFDGQWPFAEADDTLTIVCDHVIDGGMPILRVSHDEDGDWQFLCGGSHADSRAKIICMGCVVERDPTLVAIAELPLGWGADRTAVGDEWVREMNPPPDPDADDA